MKSKWFWMLGLLCMFLLGILAYRSMSQINDSLDAYYRIHELMNSLTLCEKRVEPEKLEAIRQGAFKLRINSKIDAKNFSNLLQIENKDELYRDSLTRDFNVTPDKIDIYNDMVLIRFVIRSEPFRLVTPSVYELKLFSYQQYAVEGLICFSRKE